MAAVSMMAGFVLACGVANADYSVTDGFETAWSGDYAPGWENSEYRHGAPPIGKMMQQTTTAHSGSYGMKLIADSAPVASMFWAAVNPIEVSAVAMQKQYNPYISAWYYDEGAPAADADLGRTGQIYAVPSWVNGYTGTSGDEDWTDIQFGGRRNVDDNYYSVAAGQNSPGWQNTGVTRSLGWHQLKMELSSTDGKVHFSLDGVGVGTSYRNDYVDLGTDIGLYTMFEAPLSGWSVQPYTIWDDFEFGSTYVVPVPAAVWLGMLGLGYAGMRLRKTV